MNPILDSDTGLAPPDHKPDREDGGWCACGAQEVYFEDWGETGYGCEARGPYRRTLDRLGWHISRRAKEAIANQLYDGDLELPEDDEDLVDNWDWDRRHKPGGRRGQ